MNKEVERKKRPEQGQEVEDIDSILLTDIPHKIFLKAQLVNQTALDLRIWINSDKYTGPTKRGVRFDITNGTWEEFKNLVSKVGKRYEESLAIKFQQKKG